MRPRCAGCCCQRLALGHTRLRLYALRSLEIEGKRSPRSAKVFLVFSNSPVSWDPCPVAIIMAANPYPLVIGRRAGAVICGRWRRTVIAGAWTWTIVVRVRSVRSTVGTEWSSHYSCCRPDDGPCHGQRKKKRVAVGAIVSPCARSGGNHKKSEPNGRQHYDLPCIHFCPPDGSYSESRFDFLFRV